MRLFWLAALCTVYPRTGARRQTLKINPEFESEQPVRTEIREQLLQLHNLDGRYSGEQSLEMFYIYIEHAVWGHFGIIKHLTCCRKFHCRLGAAVRSGSSAGGGRRVRAGGRAGTGRRPSASRRRTRTAIPPSISSSSATNFGNAR